MSFCLLNRNDGGLRRARVRALDHEELEHLVQQIAERAGRALERMHGCPKSFLAILSPCTPA